MKKQAEKGGSNPVSDLNNLSEQDGATNNWNTILNNISYFKIDFPVDVKNNIISNPTANKDIIKKLLTEFRDYDDKIEGTSERIKDNNSELNFLSKRQPLEKKATVEINS